MKLVGSWQSLLWHSAVSAMSANIVGKVTVGVVKLMEDTAVRESIKKTLIETRD